MAKPDVAEPKACKRKRRGLYLVYPVEECCPSKPDDDHRYSCYSKEETGVVDADAGAETFEKKENDGIAGIKKKVYCEEDNDIPVFQIFFEFPDIDPLRRMCAFINGGE